MEEVNECGVKPMKPEVTVIMKRVEKTVTLENGDKYLDKHFITQIEHKTEPKKGCHYTPHIPVGKMDRDGMDSMEIYC